MTGKPIPDDIVNTAEMSVVSQLNDIIDRIDKMKDDLAAVRYVSLDTQNKVASLEAIMNTKVEYLSAQIMEIKEEKTLFKRSYLYPVLAGVTLTTLGSIGTFIVVVGRILSN